MGNADLLFSDSFLENEAGNLGIYGDALWWIAELPTQIGSNYFPKTTEVRVLFFQPSIYVFCIFGFVTVSLDRHFLSTERLKKKIRRFLMQTRLARGEASFNAV